MQLTQQLRTKQQLGLTPQLQKAIRLLQMSAQELRVEIEVLAESNPLIEVEYPEAPQEGFEKTHFKSPIITIASDWQKSKSNENSDEFPEDNEEAPEQSLQDILLSQLNQLSLSSKEEIIGLTIIDSINVEGYLSLKCTDIAAVLLDQGITVKTTEIEQMLVLIQSFDPPGVGARNLAECLLLQLQRRPRHDKIVGYAQKILSQDLNLLLNKDKNKLLKQSGLKQEEFEQGFRLIQSLNSRPGTEYEPIARHYASPDVLVQKVRGEWKVKLNEAFVPQVRINQQTLALLDRAKDDTHQDYRRQRLKEARWLICSLENRQQTLLRVAQEIVVRQQGFLEHGPIALRPLTLQTIAQAVDKHESTVSRITTQKTMLTPHGLFELKAFFSSELKSENGCGASSTAIRVLIQRLIAEEDPCKPQSDNALCGIIQSQGIMIARRTVAKYRESLGVLPSIDRKIT